jgi:hypothetical protein
MLLTSGGAVPDATAAALDDLEVDRIVLGGGTDTIAEATERDLRADGALVERIAARDGRDVARRLAERAVREGALTDDLYLAADPAVALAAAPAVAQLRGSLLLLPEDAVPSFVVDRADEFVRVRFLGPMPAATRQGALDAIEERRTRGAPTDPEGPGDGEDGEDGDGDGDGVARPGRRPSEPGRRPPPGRSVDGRAGTETVVAAQAAATPLPVTGSPRSATLALGALGLAAALRLRNRDPDADPAS